MKKLLTPKVLTCVVAVFIIILGLTLGAFFDLDISKALAIKEVDGTLEIVNHPISSHVLAVLGYATYAVLGGFACAVIILNLLRKKEPLKVIEKIISIGLFFAIIALMAFLAYKSMKTISTSSFGFWHYLMMALMLFVMTFIIWFVSINLNPKVVKKCFVPAIYTIITLVSAYLFNEVAKFIWGRIRIRDLVAAGSLDGFVNWYQVSGHTGYDSFPSGHALQAILMFMIILWMVALGASKKAKVITSVGIVCWTVLMMFSRILAGAHFLSDVTAGFAVGFAFVYISFVMFERKTKQDIFGDPKESVK